MLTPGKLTQVGPSVLATGGTVSNTGLSLHRLGEATRLMGKIGDDAFGQAVKQIVSSFGAGLADGMVVDPSQPLVEEGAGAEEAQRVKGLIKKIGAYCRALRKHIEKNGVPMPNNGDCWFCMMQDVETGKSLGESSGDKDHLISHLDEKYIHGSLIWRALISRRPEQGAATIMQMGFVDIIVGEVRNYFKRQLGIA